MVAFPDVEDMVKAWVLTTSVASLVSNKVFMAMPLGAPMPSLVLSRVGGSPERGSDVPVDVARISFSVWANDRPKAKEISKTLVSAIEDLGPTGEYESVSHGGRLKVGEVISWLWIPDPQSDKPRYIVDALFTSTTL